MSDRETFRVEGPCWCPNEMTLMQARYMGHTKECSAAREGWRRDSAGLSEMARRRREYEEIGKAFVAASLGPKEGEPG